MGSVLFAGDDESLPSTSNCKLSTMILDGCGAVNHASIPRKLRSAIKKRSRESVTSPLLTSRKQHDVSTTVYRKDGAKKSKLSKKKRHITKDEKEVAEALYALAGMFTIANKADQHKIDDEKPEIQSPATLEEDTCRTLQVETRKISSEVTLGAVCPSITDVVNSTEEVISQTLEARQPVPFFSCKQAATPNAYGGKSDSCPRSTLRPLHGTNQSHEEEIHLDQVTASGLQYGKNKYKDLFPSPNLSAMQTASSETRRLFEGTIFSSQPHVVENKIISEKHTRVATESNNSWKRCSAHIYISRLIKVLQISDRKEGLPVKPTQPTTCRGSDNQMLRINGRNGDTYFSAIDIDAAEKGSSEDQNGFLLHKRPIHDDQMASETCAKQGYDFLSLGMGIRGLDTSESANGAGCFLDPHKQYYMPYMQSRNQSPMLCSLPPRNGYSSSSYYKSASSQAQQLSQYHSSSFTDRTGQYYNMGGGGELRLPDWRNGAVLNSLFPHLHAALGSKFQQLSPSQQQVIAINTSLPLKRHHNLPLGFERNGAVFQPENMHL
ncbi:hypothetical protein SASPL_148411 [Salvia splendens]|uniref:Uncharacterized protein n=1 Tax=Salvia splendens TaxID=180675 RepID=A0A8X8Z3C8_SALSN|nr:uncharacterized protein LOC121778825 [Salvia splendens]KAG6390672.1 hypothetical protein SASPL_148411 [Salvia splendens]